MIIISFHITYYIVLQPNVSEQTTPDQQPVRPTSGEQITNKGIYSTWIIYVYINNSLMTINAPITVEAQCV